MLTTVIILDAAKLAAGIVLAYFVFYLYQTEFRSGVMEKGFRYIAISFVVLDAGRTTDLISALEPGNEFAQVLSLIAGTAFSLIACYGFFLLFRVWHIKKMKPTEDKRKSQTIEA